LDNKEEYGRKNIDVIYRELIECIVKDEGVIWKLLF